MIYYKSDDSIMATQTQVLVWT